jgi:hypothetical protein
VWEDHLLAMLTRRSAARLARTCKALRGVVREHFLDLGEINLGELQAALTAFPRARKLDMSDSAFSKTWGDEDEAALVQWMCEGGRGRFITTMTSQSVPICSYFTHQALQAGALPSLQFADATLESESQRTSLSKGFLRDITDLHLVVDPTQDAEIATLSLVQQLPVLGKFKLEFNDEADVDEDEEADVDEDEETDVDEDEETGVDEDGPVQWPAFIPPSLKLLRIDTAPAACPTAITSLLRGLPGMLEASGATLDRLELNLPQDFEDMGDGLVYVAQALHCCSPTLEEFVLSTSFHNGEFRVDEDAGDEVFDSRLERLRVQWADVLAGVSACRGLQMLVIPYITAQPLFSADAAFGRLTHLEIMAYKQDPGVVGLWELMASGGLPALAKLSVRLAGRWGADEVEIAMALAFEAVAGTLTHLYLDFNNTEEDRWGREDRWERRGGRGVRAGGGGGQAAAAQGPNPSAVRRWPGLSRRGPGPDRQWGGLPSSSAVACVSATQGRG